MSLSIFAKYYNLSWSGDTLERNKSFYLKLSSLRTPSGIAETKDSLDYPRAQVPQHYPDPTSFYPETCVIYKQEPQWNGNINDKFWHFFSNEKNWTLLFLIVFVGKSECLISFEVPIIFEHSSYSFMFPYFPSFSSSDWNIYIYRQCIGRKLALTVWRKCINKPNESDVDKKDGFFGPPHQDARINQSRASF